LTPRGTKDPKRVLGGHNESNKLCILDGNPENFRILHFIILKIVDNLYFISHGEINMPMLAPHYSFHVDSNLPSSA
jgi:hypothetical protein